MEKEAIDNDNNGEDWLTDEVSSAASCLVSLHYVKLDKNSAARLDKQIRKFLGGQDKQEQEEEASLIIMGGKRNNRMLDGYEPPYIPPVAALASLITECSKPYQKRLTETDLKRDQSRLLFCKDHVRQFMLPLLKEDEDVRNGIPVVVYDSEGKEYGMRFKFWGRTMYVLTSIGWLTFCRHHSLVKDVDIVTAWMFRHRVTEKLCFVITSRRSPPATTNNRQRQRIA